MGWLVIAGLIALPVLEIALFIKSAQWIGILPTILVAIGAGIVGLWLVRNQGISNSLKMKEQLARGEMPVAQMFDSACLAIAGFLLLLPGFFSDILALALLLPPVRALMRQIVLKNAVVMTNKGQSAYQRSEHPDIIDGDFTIIDPDHPNGPGNHPHNSGANPPRDRLSPPDA